MKVAIRQLFNFFQKKKDRQVIGKQTTVEVTVCFSEEELINILGTHLELNSEENLLEIETAYIEYPSPIGRVKQQSGLKLIIKKA